eukprot:364948-Chlamydomonas_euryale.AAC.7
MVRAPAVRVSVRARWWQALLPDTCQLQLAATCRPAACSPQWWSPGLGARRGGRTRASGNRTGAKALSLQRLVRVTASVPRLVRVTA